MKVDLQKSIELIDRQAGLPNDASQSSFRYFFVIGNNDTPMGISFSSEDNMTSTLAILFVANFGQCLDYFTPRNARQDTHAPTSTSSSLMGGGTASSWASRLSMYSSIASLMFSVASSLV